jgi:hypothetical protein
MNNIQKRFLYFLCGCVLLRTIFALIAKNNVHYLPIMGTIALVPAIGFFYIYFTGSRKTGPEVLGEKIWWNDLRPVHGFLYLLFAINAFEHNPNSWMILMLDVIIGLIAFLQFHFESGNFSKLFI